VATVNKLHTGIRSLISGVVIPPDLKPNKLGNYLDDISHEY
jgi:hypothetical protein